MGTPRLIEWLCRVLDAIEQWHAARVFRRRFGYDPLRRRRRQVSVSRTCDNPGDPASSTGQPRKPTA